MQELSYALGVPTTESMTWPNFVTRFRVEFTLAVEVQEFAKEFLDMRQTTETVAKITAMFGERELLVPKYTNDEEMRKTRYQDMLRSKIMEFVSFFHARH